MVARNPPGSRLQHPPFHRLTELRSPPSLLPFRFLTHCLPFSTLPENWSLAAPGANASMGPYPPTTLLSSWPPSGATPPPGLHSAPRNGRTLTGPGRNTGSNASTRSRGRHLPRTRTAAAAAVPCPPPRHSTRIHATQAAEAGPVSTSDLFSFA